MFYCTLNASVTESTSKSVLVGDVSSTFVDLKRSYDRHRRDCQRDVLAGAQTDLMN